MKQVIIVSMLATLSFLMGCRKEDNPKLPDLVRIPAPLITKDATTDQVISSQNPTAFKGKFIVDVYFKEDVKPQKYDVVAIKNGNKSKVVTIQDNVTTFPTTIEITGTQLASSFGEPVKLGDRFDIGVNITTQSGQFILAFPATGNAYASGFASQPGASTSINYTVVCPFNINDFVGSATIEDPDFWGSTYPVTVTLQGTDTYKITGWIEEPSLSILVKVNSVSLQVTISKQVYSSKLPGTPYTNPAVEGTGTIDACNKKIVMSLTNSVDQGSFGASTITLKK
ncbi:MAG: hypothetical protein ICV65_13865 [Flavisolibacter sp.]|nr:hypothetical protein [Flavisolibacter sp.]